MTGMPNSTDPEPPFIYLGHIDDFVDQAPQDADDPRDDDPDLAVAGDQGTRRYTRDRPHVGVGTLKWAAGVKTADFSLLRADFCGEEVVFEPWLSLRLVEHHRIVSWAAYQPASSDEPEEGSVYPDVAWRRVEWDLLRDADRFRAAPDKCTYLRGDTQIDSRIRFGRLAELPRLAAAIREGIEVMAGGVVVHAVDRPDMAWLRLHVSATDMKAVLNLDYAPRVTRCGKVESWAQRWSTMIDSLDDTGAVEPDGVVTVSYELSYDELIAWTHRFPRPTVDRWLAAPPGTPVPEPVI